MIYTTYKQPNLLNFSKLFNMLYLFYCFEELIYIKKIFLH